jgi:hypothetical protein
LKSTDTADIVAAAVVNDYCAAQIGLSDTARPGLGWFPGKHDGDGILAEFPKEVKSLLSKHEQWLRNICFMADNDWNRYHHHNVISDMQRRAAENLGLNSAEHEWMNIQVVEGMQTCPACGSRIRPDVIVCSTCRCIIDKDRYTQYQFAS